MEDIRVLLVDDEDQFRRVVAKRLGKRGLSVEEAEDGDACLAYLEQRPVDVVVLDVKMPGMNGLEVLRRIRQRFEGTEVILLTGHATPGDGVEGIKSGAFDYLSKPVEIDHLVSKITQAYEKRRREEEKSREEAFRAGMEQRMIAAERLASLGTLAAGVAHEINNPLAIMNDSVGWLKLLLEREEMAGMPLRDQFQKGLDKIEQSVRRAKKITHQLLGFVRQGESALCAVDLGALIEETVQLVGKEARQKDLEVRRDLDPRLGEIESDPDALRQVLINLLTNAVHATGPGGKITLGALRDGQEALLSVQDTGEGIAEEHRERVFEPFFSTKPAGQGTGLGLFVSRGLIARLGGSMDFESALGRGTTFSIRLPIGHRPDRDEEEEEGAQGGPR